MGMYDTVNAPAIPCKGCGTEISGWQTKDTNCDLETVQIQKVTRFYSSCRKCHMWHEYRLRPAKTLEDFELTWTEPNRIVGKLAVEE